jgi:hypothetical protein
MGMNRSPEINLTQLWLRDLGVEMRDILEIAACYLVIEDHHFILPFVIQSHLYSLQDHKNAIQEGRKMMYTLDESDDFHTKPTQWQTKMNELKSMSDPRIVLVCFATEGMPHDNGLPLFHCIEPFVKAVLLSGIKEVKVYTPRILRELFGEEIAERCTKSYQPPARIILQNYHNVGMGAWRAEILKYTVDTSNDGDIVIFHDPNWEKYPGILHGFAPQAKQYALAAAAISSRSGIFAPPHFNLIHTMTKFVYDRLKDPEKHNIEELLNLPAGRCRCIVITVSEQTRQFVKKFSEACSDPENLFGGSDAKTEFGGWKIPGFIHNAAEQAVFNALVYGSGLWDPVKDPWICGLGTCGTEPDTGTEQIISFAKHHKLLR